MQLCLAGRFSRHILFGVVCRNPLVGGGVKCFGIDAVENSLQNIAAIAKNAVEALAVLRRLNLSRVSGGDGRYRVRVVKTAEHVVDGAGVAS